MNIGIVKFFNPNEMEETGKYEFYAMLTPCATVEEFRDQLDSHWEEAVCVLQCEGSTVALLETICATSNDGEESFVCQLETLFTQVFNAGRESGSGLGFFRGAT